MTGDAHSTRGKELYPTGLKNAHALESQAVQILSRQVERLQGYPEMQARLCQHMDEGKALATRLEETLHWAAAKPRRWPGDSAAICKLAGQTLP